MNYRDKKCFNVVTFPVGFDEENRLGCKELCCTPLLKIASLTSNENYKNDVTSVVLKRSSASDTIILEVEKCGTSGIISNLGENATFPFDSLAFGFIFNWKQYLSVYGEGNYKIRVSFVINGVTGGYDYGFYELKSYSIYNVKNTVRVWSEPNSFSQFESIDYTASNVKDCIRFNGFFGNRQPKTEINNLISKGRIVEKVLRENLNSYELRTDPIDIKITRRLIDFHFLNEDKLLISDFNNTNHDYLIFDKQVALEESAEIEYIDRSRLSKISAIFGDRKKNVKSFYNKK